jgi:zinc protease
MTCASPITVPAHGAGRRVGPPGRAAATLLSIAATVLAMISIGSLSAGASTTRASHFKLANGMEVVVVPDRRAPVVTHMVWYRVGAADEPRGVSGIAHFLEHLMFKSTDAIPSGEFSKRVSRLGGQDNAFTGQDVTAYFQRISKDRLATVMAMEADRMVNLKLTDEEVTTERRVILEERRSRVDANPMAILDEQMDATLYQAHPYGTPVIGWEHEMAKLSRKDALDFYKHYYAPNNAILVVTGDVGPDEVRALAEEHFGKIPANPAIVPRVRNQEPPHPAARRVSLLDPRAGKPSLRRYYLAPSYGTAEPGEAEALDLLMKIVGGGATSRLYRHLVVETKVASSAGGWYSGTALDSGRLGLGAVAADGVDLTRVEAAIDEALERVRREGVTEAELDRAKKSYLAEYIYQSDNQSTLARRYGWSLTTGRSIADIEQWPDRIRAVTLDDVKKAARHLDIRRSVTGTLVAPSADAAPQAVKPSRS